MRVVMYRGVAKRMKMISSLVTRIWRLFASSSRLQKGKKYKFKMI